MAGKGLDVSKPYGSHLKPILDRIKASDEQRTKISQIVESYRSRIQPLRDEYKQRRESFLASMTSGATAETIMTRQVELSHLSSEITSRYTLMRLEVRRQLTPQQILQFEAYARENGWNKR
jgi:flagellar biosynthesis chaperone FliJ